MVFRSPLPFVSFLEKSLPRIPETRNITTGDFNGDVSPDLIFHTSDPEIIWTSLGDGNGNFTLPKKHGFGTGYSSSNSKTSFLAGDFNGDGRDELISIQKRRIRSGTGEATLFLVSSSMTNENIFNENMAVPIPATLTGSDNRFFFFGNDINGDNKKDFVFGDKFSPEFFVINDAPALWAASSGHISLDSITTIDSKMNIAENDRTFQVLMFDANNDGMADLIKMGNNEIFLFYGDKDEFLVTRNTTRQSGIVAALSQGMFLGADPAVYCGHLNRDAFLDLFVTNEKGKCQILTNRSGRGFSLLIDLDFPETPIIEPGDFNGDGLADLVAYGRDQRGIRILLNSGNGFFKTIERPVGNKMIRGLAVHDINGDGLSDIILTLKGSFWGLEGRVLLNISQRMQN